MLPFIGLSWKSTICVNMRWKWEKNIEYCMCAHTVLKSFEVHVFVCCMYQSANLRLWVLFTLWICAGILDRPVSPLIALVCPSRWQGPFRSCLFWDWRVILNRKRWCFHSLSPHCSQYVTLPPQLKWIGYYFRHGHSCVWHGIHSELIMRETRKKSEVKRMETKKYTQ